MKPRRPAMTNVHRPKDFRMVLKHVLYKSTLTLRARFDHLHAFPKIVSIFWGQRSIDVIRTWTAIQRAHRPACTDLQRNRSPMSDFTLQLQVDSGCWSPPPPPPPQPLAYSPPRYRLITILKEIFLKIKFRKMKNVLGYLWVNLGKTFSMRGCLCESCKRKVGKEMSAMMMLPRAHKHTLCARFIASNRGVVI